jgi:MOSC domain-containing protein YiiM
MNRTMHPTVRSVNIGAVERVPYRGRVETTGIFKQPTDQPVTVTIDRFGDDVQADLESHGGPDRVGYAYAEEDLQWWADTLDRPVPPGSMGENLTVSGLDVTNAVIGEQWQVGTTVFAVAGLRTPCFKLGIRMGKPGFSRQFTSARRPGAYLRVLTPGVVSVGDRIDVLSRPDHGVTMALLADAYHRDPSLVVRLLDAPELADGWREWALEQLDVADLA